MDWLEKRGSTLIVCITAMLIVALLVLGLAALAIRIADYRAETVDKRECHRSGGVIEKRGESWTCAKTTHVEAP